jgi:hypothetical protein
MRAVVARALHHFDELDECVLEVVEYAEEVRHQRKPGTSVPWVYWDAEDLDEALNNVSYFLYQVKSHFPPEPAPVEPPKKKMSEATEAGLCFGVFVVCLIAACILLAV